MSTIYVSNSATNGYSVGSDSNDGSAKGLSVLTITRGLALASAGDTVKINDGVYSEASFIAPGVANLGITPETAYGVTVRAASGTTRVLHIAAAATGIRVGKIILDAQAAQGYCVTLDSGAAVNVVTISGAAMMNFVVSGLGSTTKARTISLVDGWSATGSGLTAANVAGIDLKPDAASTITINDGNVSLSGNCSTTLVGVNVQAGAGGGTASVTDVAVSLTQTAPAAGNSILGVNLENLSTATADDNTITMSAAGVISLYSGIRVPDDASIACAATVNRNTITGPSGPQTGYSGYGVLIGVDAAGNNTVTAVADENVIVGCNHAILLGGVTSCKARYNTLRDCAYGVVMKHSTSCEYDGNLILNPTINAILFKADTGSLARHNTAVCTADMAAQAVRVTHDGASMSSGCSVKNNLVVCTGSEPADVVLVDTGNAAAFDGNRPK